MARMTEEEADYWDEYYTKNPDFLFFTLSFFFCLVCIKADSPFRLRRGFNQIA